jgi:PAS domain S-box-containing protein
MTIEQTSLLEALPVAVYTTDAEGRITFYNRAAAQLWGCEPAPGSYWCGSWRIYHLDGRPLPHDECPMAQALKQQRPIRGVEAILERPNGERVAFAPYPTPLFDQAGRLIGALNLLIDVTERRRHEEAAIRLATIVSSSDDAIISKTLEGQITTWNAGAERIFGYTAEEMIGAHITRIIPPGLHDEEADILARLQRGERIDHYETVRMAKDGRRLDISITVSPMRDSTGRIIGASKVARDITDRKRAEDVQRLLIDELNHRIKNTLATVQAIATQTLRRAPDPDSFVSSFTGRIQSMARAHSLLTGASFQSADIHQLVRDQLLLGGDPDQRIAWSGPSLLLEAQAALHLALVLHELGTNARKYGALSTATGRVDVCWEMHTNGGRRLALDWRESGGPKVTAPSSRGFGSILIEQSLQAHGGRVMVTYAETGLTCSINLPLPDLRQPLRVSARGPTPPKPLPAPAARAGLAGKRVLVIEDEPLIAMVLSDYLADAGCTPVGPAQSLPRALTLIREEAFDAALVDGNLAGRSVDEIAVALTQRGVPFVFVTGYGREALPQAFREAKVVEKPFTQDQVIGALERLLARGGNISPLRAPKSGA